jgi:FtsP/CotA-like multicopper oxidase with cupredoxin domain
MRTMRIWSARRGVGPAVLAPICAMALIALSLPPLQQGLRADSGLGPAYDLASAVDANPAPNVFETTLVAAETRVPLGDGVVSNAFTFNGTIPGPEIRVQAGDTLVVHFRNDLAQSTGIHWHGIELNNASDGSSLTQNAVEPGGTFLYRFVVPRPGTYWYHPHHSATNQVFRGLYGSLIVTDPHEETLVSEGVLPSAAATTTLALSDVTVCKKPGENDEATYPADPTLPWAGGSSYPGHPFPATPRQLCETTPLGNDGHPVSEPYRRGDIPNIQPSQQCARHAPGCRVNEGQVVLTNGEIPTPRAGSPEAPGRLKEQGAALHVKAGQGVRLQIINMATTRFFRLRMTDSEGQLVPLYRVGGEGGLLNNVRAEGGAVTDYDSGFGRGEILLAPASRADVVVAFPSDATGVATLWTLDYRRGVGGRNGWASLPTLPVAHFKIRSAVSDPFQIGVGDPLLTHPSVNDPVEDLSDDNVTDHLLPRTPGTSSENIRLTMQPGVVPPSIEGMRGTHEHATADYYTASRNDTTRWAELGDLLELRVTNTSPLDHPFHLHGFSIQPIRFERPDGSTALNFGYPEFRDNFNLPAGTVLVFRVRLTDRPLMDGTSPGGGVGRWAFHCHIFNHASLGMVSELVVISSDGQAPLLDLDQTSVEVGGEGTATNSGTVFDPDGGPITLSASTGTILYDKARSWSWVYAGGEELPATVFITATDEQGLRNQLAFRLTEPPDDGSEVVRVVREGHDLALTAVSGSSQSPATAQGRRLAHRRLAVRNEDRHAGCVGGLTCCLLRDGKEQPAADADQNKSPG